MVYLNPTTCVANGVDPDQMARSQAFGPGLPWLLRSVRSYICTQRKYGKLRSESLKA